MTSVQSSATTTSKPGFRTTALSGCIHPLNSWAFCADFCGRPHDISRPPCLFLSPFLSCDINPKFGRRCYGVRAYAPAVHASNAIRIGRRSAAAVRQGPPRLRERTDARSRSHSALGVSQGKAGPQHRSIAAASPAPPSRWPLARSGGRLDCPMLRAPRPGSWISKPICDQAGVRAGRRPALVQTVDADRSEPRVRLSRPQLVRRSSVMS